MVANQNGKARRGVHHDVEYMSKVTCRGIRTRGGARIGKRGEVGTVKVGMRRKLSESGTQGVKVSRNMKGERHGMLEQQGKTAKKSETKSECVVP